MFVGISAFAQSGTINYFVAPDAWVKSNSDDTVVTNGDYTTVTASNKVYAGIFMPDGLPSEYKIADIDSFSITTRQTVGASNTQNVYFNIFTQKTEGSPNWYGSRLNSDTWNSVQNADKYTGAGNWYTWSTDTSSDKASLLIYDSSAKTGDNGSGWYGQPAFGTTLDELKSGAVSITNPTSGSSYSKDYSQEKLYYISVNVDDTQNNMPNAGLDIKSMNMTLKGQDYAWNFLGSGSTWNVSGNQIAADKISNMTVNVSGEGSVLTTQSGVSNSFINVGASAKANVSDGVFSGMQTTANWNNGEHYNSIPLISVNSGTVELDASEFSNNTLVFNGSPNSGIGAQGVIKVSNGTLKVSNSTFSNNTSNTIPAESFGSTPNTQGSVLYAGDAKSVEISNTKFTNNTATGAGVQGGAIATFGGSYKINDSVFEGNVADNTAYSSGSVYAAAAYFSDNSWADPKTSVNVEISNTTFKKNETKGFWAYGGAVYVYSNVEGSNFKISNSNFEGNKIVGTEDAIAGALYINKGSAVVENTSFNGNSATVSEAGTGFSWNGGGALVIRNANVTISATKDITNVGNYFDNAGVKDDARGGFLFLRDTNTVNFDISENATYTIGNGAEGYDSIASENKGTADQSVIKKTGAGTLTVNGSMEHFTGKLTVEAGFMNANNKLGASEISISSGATLGVTIKGQNSLTNDTLVLNNSGKLNLIAGTRLSKGDYTISSNSELDFAQNGIVAFGGTISGNIFKVEEATSIVVDSNKGTTVSDNGRIVITDSASTETKPLVEMAFNADNVTIEKVETVANFEEEIAQLGEFENTQAYSFSVTGLDQDAGESVVLSFYVGEGLETLKVDNFTVFHKGSENVWEKIDAEGAVFDGEYFSFVVSHFSSYAIATSVPEPAEWATIFGAVALGFVMYRRRK